MKFHSLLLVVGLLVGGFTFTANAHHAITLNYNSENSGTIEGVVQEVFWANPHIHYYIEVTNEEGTTETWDMETGNTRVMAAQGINRDTIEPGDRIRVTGTLGRDGIKRILADRVERPDGTVIMGGDDDE